ncbi:MAG: hypothetical protein ACYCS1_11385 [Gammaproteobacteria bacterium]
MRLLALRVCISLLGLAPVVSAASTCQSLTSRKGMDRVCYQHDQHHLRLVINITPWNIPLVGYATTAPQIVQPRHHRGTLVISFVDLAGLSAGGGVDILRWRKGLLSRACNGELYANFLHAFSVGRRAYLALFQHYTGNYYYASRVVEIRANGWSETNAKVPWRWVIDQYHQNLAEINNRYGKASYLAFIASAYMAMSDLTKAREYEERSKREYKGENAFLDSLQRRTEASKLPLRSGDWCEILPARQRKTKP